MIQKITFLTLILFLLSISNQLVAESKVSKVDKILSQSIDKNLYDITENGRFVKIQLDRSLDNKYKNLLHQWLQIASQKNKSLNQVYITWRPKSFLLSKVSSISFLLTFLSLLSFLFLSLKVLSRKSEEINEEDLVKRLVEEKIKNTLLNKQILPVPKPKQIDYTQHLYK